MSEMLDGAVEFVRRNSMENRGGEIRLCFLVRANFCTA